MNPGLLAVVPSNVVDKWQTLDRVLSMLRDLGALCLQLGEARETILYLRQGMDVARAFGLPHRLVLRGFAKFKKSQNQTKLDRSPPPTHPPPIQFFFFETHTNMDRTLKS